MKRGSVLAGLLVLSLMLGGCDLWTEGYYHNVVPHMQEHESASDEKIRVSTYMELRNALEKLVEECAQKRVIYTAGIAQENMETYMQMAIAYVRLNNPIGAYALEGVSYDIGTNVGVQAVAVEFTYSHLRSEIMQIKRTQSMEEAIEVITTALNNCDAGVVLQVENFKDIDLTQLIQDYVDETPWKCMEMPQVAEMVYPDHGNQRVIELSFTYQTSRETLRVMQETVETVFSSAEMYVRGNPNDRGKYAQLYSFLMERHNYKIETSITPAYSLLYHGVGDEKAFATVYAAMCRQAGLECRVVYGTRRGERWCWNLIQDGDAYYHLDLLECVSAGGFRLKSAGEMEDYVWDYSAYPEIVQPDKNN